MADDEIYGVPRSIVHHVAGRAADEAACWKTSTTPTGSVMVRATNPLITQRLKATEGKSVWVFKDLLEAQRFIRDRVTAITILHTAEMFANGTIKTVMSKPVVVQ